MHSKIFDNGVICASEQAVIAAPAVYDAVKAEFIARGGYVLNADERQAVRNTMMTNGVLNAAVVGQTPDTIADLARIDIPRGTKLLIGEVDSTDLSEPFAHEKLSPVLALYRADNFDDALDKADRLVKDGGYGHTASIYIDTRVAADRLARFEARMKACRILVNTPASQGAIGDIYNFRLAPSLTLGCGSWGGNSVAENVGVRHLLNIKTVADRRENMLWFRVPQSLYIKRGCLPVALEDVQKTFGFRRAFIVTDSFLYHNGYTDRITANLTALGVRSTVFFDVEPDPTLACAKAGAAAMTAFEPDAVIAVGGGSAMDAAKIMWVMYEHPAVDFADMAMRFMDIRKRICPFPKMGEKAPFIAIPTTAGTGSEVTPFAVITDEKSGIKYPLADYALMPHVAVVDPDLMMHQPPALTAASGIDALTHALEAFASMAATDYTDALVIQALKQLFDYLPRCFENGAADPEAREKVANAATMAGMAFANAFLGICHSMAHKLGAFHHLPHGIANALLITHVMRFNIAPAPTRMGSFPQYDHPHALERYAVLAAALGLAGDTDEEKANSLIRAVERLKDAVGIRRTIADYGITKEAFLSSLDDMVTQAFDDQCTGANPRYPLMSEIRELYLDAYGAS